MTERIPGLSRGRGVGTTILVSALTSAIVAAATVLVMQRVPLGAVASGGGPDAPTGDSVDVPSVVSMPPDGARELLKGRGLRMVIRGERPDPTVPAGWIVEQNPMPGSQVQSGSEVEAKVSSGPERIAVPDVVGRPIAEARSAIEAAGLRVGSVQETGTGTPGTVTSTTPGPSSRVTPDTEIALVVTPAEATPEGVEVPQLRRLSLTDARRALEAVGLRVGRTRETYDEGLPARVVIRSQPRAGDRVPTGTAVDLVLNEAD